MPQGPGFYETVNPESIIPLALKKFDIETRKRQLDIIEQEHKLKINELTEQAGREKLLRSKLQEILAQEQTPGQPPITNLQGSTGLFPISTEIAGFGNKMGELKKPMDTKAMLREIAPLVKDPMDVYKQLVELEKVKPVNLTGDDYLAGLGTPEQRANFISGKKEIQKETIPATSEIYKKLVDVYGKEAVDKMSPDERMTNFKKIEVLTTKPTSYEDVRNAAIEELKKEGVSDPTLSAITKRVEEKQRKSRLLTPEEEAQQIKIAKVKAENTQAVWGAQGFKTWTPSVKEQSFLEDIITGKKPQFAYRDTESKSLYENESRQYQLDMGLNPGTVARMKTDYKSLDKSTSNQRKIYDMMSSFVGNINFQVGEVERRFKELPRTDTRLFNMPIVEVRKRITGSGEEASIKSYLIEISNEIGKLSTGSAASIRELSVDAQKQWKDIHDEKLSYNDIMKVMQTTRDQANGRLRMTKIAMDATRSAIETIVGPGGSSQEQIPTGGITVDPSKIKKGW